MKQMTKILVATGLILSLIAIACNKNNRPETIPDNISHAVILAWNEIAFETIGGSANEHSLLRSRIYAMMHASFPISSPALITDATI